jgi:hypothetical protein
MSGHEKKSKTSSAAKSGSPRSGIVFFVDRSLGRYIVVNALRAEGAAVEAHDDHFGQLTSDIDWLGEVGRRGWVVLSKDARIRSTPAELEALKLARVHAFFLTRQDLVGREMARIFVAALPKMEVLVTEHTAPALFKISRKAHIERLA